VILVAALMVAVVIVFAMVAAPERPASRRRVVFVPIPRRGRRSLQLLHWHKYDHGRCECGQSDPLLLRSPRLVCLAVVLT